MSTRTKVVLGLFVFGAATLLLALLLKQPPPPPQTRLPVPNGYDDFVSATKVLESNAGDLRELSEEELRAFVSRNSNAFELLRSGLTRACQVPLDASTNYFDKHLPEISQFKRLAHALMAAGRLAEMERRTNDALRIYLETIQFAQQSAQGGLEIDKLVSFAIESLGASRVQQLTGSLDAAECRDAIRVIQDIDAASESPEVTLNREMNWARQRGIGWLHRITARIALRASQERFAKRAEDQQRSRRLLLLDLAVRAYALEKSQTPRQLGDLVPAYLKSIPQDPQTGTNLSYYLH